MTVRSLFTKVPLLIVILSSVSCAYSSDAEESTSLSSSVVIANSQSPDGHKNIAITDTSNAEESSGMANVREIKTGKSLCAIPWEYGPRPGEGGHPPSENSFTVAWRLDSKAFSIEQEVAYGESGCQVFAQFSDGNFHEVVLPVSKGIIDEKYHLSSKGKGYMSVIRWLSHNRFVVELCDSRWDRTYLVTCRILSHANRSLRAKIDSIRPIKSQFIESQ